MSTPARPEDVDEICGSLPETELGISWGDRPTWKVPRGDKGNWRLRLDSIGLEFGLPSGLVNAMNRNAGKGGHHPWMAC